MFDEQEQRRLLRWLIGDHLPKSVAGSATLALKLYWPLVLIGHPYIWASMGGVSVPCPAVPEPFRKRRPLQ